MASDLQSRLTEQIARLDPATPAARRAVYDEARQALSAEIRAGAPFVSVQDGIAKRRELESAVIAIERGASRNDPPPEPKRGPKPERDRVKEPAAVEPVVIGPEREAAADLPADEPQQDRGPQSESPSALEAPMQLPERRAEAPQSVPLLPAEEDAAVESVAPDHAGKDTPVEAPPRSTAAARPLVLYMIAAALLVGIVVIAAAIAGLGLDQIRGGTALDATAPAPELRLRTGPAGISPTVNPAAALFKSAGFNVAAAAALKDGNARLARGDFNGAVAAFDDAIRLDPGQSAALGNRAFAYWRKGEIDRAIGDYSQAIELDPSNFTNRLNRAIAYNRVGEYERAVADLDRVIAAQPDNVEALNSRCWARAMLVHLQEALADCNDALKRRANDANILNSRGFVHLRLGRLDRAIADYNAALRAEPKLAGSLYGRGLAKVGRGDRAGGNEDVAAARALDPGIQETFARYGIR